MIDPKTVNLLGLPYVTLEQRSQLPSMPCIYFAIDCNNVVQYIGQTTDVKARWATHHRYKELKEIGGVKIAYLHVDDIELLLDIEEALINWFNPLLNKELVWTGKPKSSDQTICFDGKIYRTEIQWRLREVMDRHGIQAKDLATEMGLSRNAVSNLRAFEMPRIDGDRLNQLIVSLNRLRKAKNNLITPSDLIGFTLSPEEMRKIGIH